MTNQTQDPDAERPLPRSDFWRRVRENDTRRFDESGKAIVEPGKADADVIPDAKATEPL